MPDGKQLRPDRVHQQIQPELYEKPVFCGGDQPGRKDQRRAAAGRGAGRIPGCGDGQGAGK